MKDDRYKISFFLNIIIVIMTICASIFMFTGYRFMSGDGVILESTKLGMFKFFTVDSNLFMGIVSLFFLIYEKKLIKGEIAEIPKGLYCLKLMATTSVMLTFVIVFIYLSPLVGSIYKMIMNSNLFFHLLIPLCSLITFVFFEKTDKLSFKYSFLGIVPTFLYALFYLINVLIHMENGTVSTQYDFYWFVQNGVWTSLIVIPIMLIITYIMSFVLWKFNRIRKEI